jgi:transposase InsO family protein
MPWQEVSTMSLRKEFVMLASQPECNRRELCRRFNISTKTGYKWLARYQAGGDQALYEHSRRPHRSPERTTEILEQAVLGVRTRHPTWGGRKIHTRLQTLGYQSPPAPSTITAILRRHGLLTPPEADSPHAWQRFEQATPNALWQMDFKGPFALAQGRCHPLTVLDDHSRFSLCLKACANEQRHTVQHHLTHTFRRYGLPQRMLMDNGPPWGDDRDTPLTGLTVWLIRLGIGISHSRPYHPQTLGKDERFHRTLKGELLQQRQFNDLFHCQWHFDRWRNRYNLERPHESLQMAVPASRYQQSPRPFPETLPAIEYAPADQVRKVQAFGYFHYQGHVFRTSKALRGQSVALRPTPQDGIVSVYFCHYHVTDIDLRHPIK